MSKRQSNFTDEQARAVETADRRFAARTIVNLAAAGELAPELAPFEISVSSVGELRRKADAAKREGGKAREERLDTLDQDIIATMTRALREINAEGKVDAARLRLLTAARKNMREANYGPGKSAPETDSEEGTETPALMARLAEKGQRSTTHEDTGSGAASGV